MDMTLKSPEPKPEPETPTRILPAKPISFSNGIIKQHHHHHHPIAFTYKECLKNHSAASGGHALDGCGEFMPSPSSTPSDPTSLKCAACGCHRNFHRRELASPVPPPSSTIEYQPHHRHHPPPPLPRSPNSSSPPPISSSYTLLALTKPRGNSFAAKNHAPGSRKRFRTKFSQTQKEKMHEFAERIGWKIQKRDEDDVRDFCRHVGVDRGVLKVWMHNNKNSCNNRRDLTFSGDIAAVKMVEDDGVLGGNGVEQELHRGGDSGGADGGNASTSSGKSNNEA